MEQVSTIQLRRDVITLLKEAKEYPRQTYNELLTKMAAIFMEAKKRNQYDEFLHKIQQPKLQETWDPSDDAGWEE